jgi:hypothetical protein
MKNYHVSRDGAKFGHYDEATALYYYKEGNIAPSDMVWCDVMVDWSNAMQVFSTNTINAAILPNRDEMRFIESVNAATLSPDWLRRFALIEKAGGVKLPKFRELSFSEAWKIEMNILAFLFGPFYFFAKGMPKRAFSVILITISLSLLYSMVEDYFGFPESLGHGLSLAFSFGWSFFANLGYYKKIKLNNNGWF